MLFSGVWPSVAAASMMYEALFLVQLALVPICAAS